MVDTELRKRKVTLLGREYEQREPMSGEVDELADLYFKIEVGSASNEPKFKLNNRERKKKILMTFFTPPIDPDITPGRYYTELEKAISDWEEWSGLNSFLAETQQRYEEQLAPKTGK